mgnify:CR=1 FL=1
METYQLQIQIGEYLVNLLSQLEELSSSAEVSNKKNNSASMDNRTIGTGAQILRNLGVENMNVHMSSPKNISGLTGFGLVVEDITVLSESNA